MCSCQCLFMEYFWRVPMSKWQFLTAPQTCPSRFSLSVFVECWEALGRTCVCVSNSLEVLSIPSPRTSFFFFFWIEITVFLSFHFRSVLSPNVSEEPPCLSHRFSLSVLIHCHWINETSLVSLKPTRFSIYLHRLSTERGAGKSK